MITQGMQRVTMTLDPIDVDLLDRLGRLEGKNRSEELRSILTEVRPMLQATVTAFEAAVAQRERFDAKAAEAAVSGLLELLPEVEGLSNAYLGALSRIEGAEAAAADVPGPRQSWETDDSYAARLDSFERSKAADPRPSNHGGHTPTPPPASTPSDEVEK